MRLSLVVPALVALAGPACTADRPTDRPRAPEPAMHATPRAGDAGVPLDALLFADALADSAMDAQASDAAVAMLERPGQGTCHSDTDCVLTSYQVGCCAQACQSYASSKQALAARQAQEDCVAFKASGEPCPPPAPCRRPTTRSVAARCSAGTCYTVLAPIAGAVP
jgi:hypothetical protein